jgi:predicted GNAT family N-acyltransferase
MTAPPAFRVEPIDYATGLADLRAVREAVFVHEQQVPLALEWDELDPLCLHVVARDDGGRPIGTCRLTPTHKLGRMAVLRDWRGRGVGDALLGALLERAREQGWREVTLHAQASAIDFYGRHGFVPQGGRFEEAGIEHQAMRRTLSGPTAIDSRDAAVAITAALVARARRSLWIYSRELDPGLYDHGQVMERLRQLATAGLGGEIRIIVQNAEAPQRALAPLVALSQRLPSVLQFREVGDPVDREYPSAFLVNDTGGYYFRGLGHRFDGEAELDGAARARQLIEAFRPVWERARPVSEYRALGL